MSNSRSHNLNILVSLLAFVSSQVGSAAAAPAQETADLHFLENLIALSGAQDRTPADREHIGKELESLIRNFLLQASSHPEKSLQGLQLAADTLGIDSWQFRRAAEKIKPTLLAAMYELRPNQPSQLNKTLQRGLMEAFSSMAYRQGAQFGSCEVATSTMVMGGVLAALLCCIDLAFSDNDKNIFDTALGKSAGTLAIIAGFGGFLARASTCNED
jgi:hypothetical protein